MSTLTSPIRVADFFSPTRAHPPGSPRVHSCTTPVIRTGLHTRENPGVKRLFCFRILTRPPLARTSPFIFSNTSRIVCSQRGANNIEHDTSSCLSVCMYVCPLSHPHTVPPCLHFCRFRALHCSQRFIDTQKQCTQRVNRGGGVNHAH